MATFAHFVGVRRSCRALQFILTAAEAAIATQRTIIGASLSEPLLDELAGAMFWYIYIYIYIYNYIYIYICIHGQSIWSRVGPP